MAPNKSIPRPRAFARGGKGYCRQGVRIGDSWWMDKLVKIPGPDHPISIESNVTRVVVTAGGRVIADTREALTLREAAYPAVQYIPRQDVDMSLLERTEH